MKSVHIGLNKRHFIYDKINIFSCAGCTCDFSFLPVEVEEHSVELF